jgi:peroxiredoxin
LAENISCLGSILYWSNFPSLARKPLASASSTSKTTSAPFLRYTFTVLSDPNAEVIRRYHLLHAGGGPDGHDIARPAEFLVDSSGMVRWVNFTEDVRVRARADEMLAAAKGLR